MKVHRLERLSLPKDHPAKYYDSRDFDSLEELRENLDTITMEELNRASRKFGIYHTCDENGKVIDVYISEEAQLVYGPDGTEGTEEERAQFWDEVSQLHMSGTKKERKETRERIEKIWAERKAAKEAKQQQEELDHLPNFILR